MTVPARGKPTILFFYPKDNTPGCTLEAKAFKDAYATLRKKGAEVIGVSSDSVDSHKSFCDDLELPYTLLADGDGSVRELYDIPSDLFGLLPGRQTFVIGKDGTVLEVRNSDICKIAIFVLFYKKILRWCGDAKRIHAVDPLWNNIKWSFLVSFLVKYHMV